MVQGEGQAEDAGEAQKEEEVEGAASPAGGGGSELRLSWSEKYMFCKGHEDTDSLLFGMHALEQVAACALDCVPSE